MRFVPVAALIAPWLLPCPLLATVPGGGPARVDCHLQLGAPAPNYPLSLPGKPATPREVRCFDGDAGCDLDGEVDGACRFPLDACFRVSDPGLPECAPADVQSFAVGGARGNADLRALQQAGQALLPATAAVCTTGQSVRVPLGRGGKKAARRVVRLKARTGAGTDADRIAFTCMPRAWPSYGYDHRNRRATPVETKLSPANAAQLGVRWTFDIAAHEGDRGAPVTSTPTVGDGMVFATSWNGKVYGLRARDGKVRWSYDADPRSFGLQSSATLTPEGRLLVGDSDGIVHALVAKTGALLWKASVADTDPAAAHIWGSPTVASGRVYVGRASHTDNPCTQGHLYAFDLETGAELWRFKTVPDRVCRNDTRVECGSPADCGGAECVRGISGGVTATVTVEPSGDTVYVGSVGCYTSPSIGNSDALFALDAATGATRWIYRTQSIEQYSDGPPYRDSGFLNGPLLVDAQDGAGGTRRLVIGPSKDGTIYAVDPASGAPVWQYSLVPNGRFSGFGLFNSAVAWANNRLYASLFQTNLPPWPRENDHLYAFSDLDGTPAWSAQIGASWSPVTVANGLVLVGTNDVSEYYVYDAASGARLNAIPMPDSVYAGAAVVDGTVYVGFNGGGGIVAIGLP